MSWEIMDSLWIRLVAPVVVMGAVSGCSTSDAARRVDIDHDYVVAQARELAEQPYEANAEQLPPFLDNLTYNEYRDIRFKRGEALWSKENLPFRAEFFHPGYLFKKPVQLREFTDTHEQEIRFRKDFFDYGNLQMDERIPASLGYAGIRILSPLNRNDLFDEVIVFQGGTYFRALGEGQTWGLSARSLAIDTGKPGEEEFPFFRKMWLGKPSPEDNSLTLYGLVDSPRATAAFTYIITPGVVTQVDITGTVFLRQPVATLGIAPLSSMFWYGENTRRHFDDFRPEVHDSDGLLIATKNGEWIWRPLDNPNTFRGDDFLTDNLRGFGLMQRDRSFASYQDLEADYERRPSVWIEPKGNWGAGSVKLYEIPTTGEYMDNIVAAWEPAQHPEPGTPYNFRYVLKWQLSPPIAKTGGYVTSTRVGRGRNSGGDTEIVIDFTGGKLDDLMLDAPVEAIVSIGKGGKILHQEVKRNPFLETWRLNLVIDPSEANVNDFGIEAYLTIPGEVLTETWKYRWNR